jgi:hypothetical protein
MRSFWLTASVSLAVVCACIAADVPAPILPQGVGVNIHFTRGHERDLDLIAAAGCKFVRMDFSWAGTERKKGEYNWGDYEELLGNLDRRGLRALFILDYSNGLYEEAGHAPQHPESVAAFARWAGAAVRHFQGRRVLWEIWNEPNISFWKPKPDVQQYITLVRATARAVRENDPHATLIAPASSEFPWEFFEAMFEAGVLSLLDGVSVHPYRNYQRSPETAAEDYLRLRALIERYAPHEKRAMPILSGEWGYSSHHKGVSLEKQAAFLVRQQLANLASGIPLSIWYDWKNDGTDPDEGEHNFGTVYPDLSPKPAYRALQVMTRELSGYRVAHRLDVGDPTAYVLLLVNAAADQKLAAWSLTGTTKVNLELGSVAEDTVTLIDGNGAPAPFTMRQGRLELPLSMLPVYATCRERSPALSVAAAWRLSPPTTWSIEAGKKNGLSLRVKVENPFPTAIAGEVRLAGPDWTERKKVRLAAGKAAEIPIAATVHRRDLGSLPVALTVEMVNASGKYIGRSSEELHFAIANPLRLDLAPMEKGVRVTIENPAGTALRGVLEFMGQKEPITVAAQAKSASYDFPVPASPGAAAAEPMKLREPAGKVIAQLPAARFQAIDLANPSARLDGDAQVPAKASLEPATAPGENPPYAKVVALNYDFAAGWRFVCCETGSAFRFRERPAALGVWVYGDNSGNSLRVRVRDVSGQTFQPNGPNVSWTGWRWVTFDLQRLDQAGHWGGANDGVVKGELTLETPLLLDSTRRPTTGRIYFAGLTAIYQ